jgi:hypothetical protein
MKYIKFFEKKNLKYKLGDYIEVRIFGGDLEIMKIIMFRKNFEGMIYDYGCEMLDKDIDLYDIYEYPFPVQEEQIIRKIEEYEIDAKKYNL